MEEEQTTFETQIETDSLEIVTEPAETIEDSTSTEVPPVTDVTGSEVTFLFTSLVTSDDELLTSVKNIEQIQLYEFGILLVFIAVFLSTVIIKTFFGKGV
jgi:hypothetical protein